MTTAVPVPTRLIGLIAGILEIDATLVTPDSAFADLGRDSAQEIELLVAIEDRYRITLDYETFADLRTVGDLAGMVAAAAGEDAL